MRYLDFIAGNTRRCITLNCIECIDMVLDTEVYDEEKRRFIKTNAITIACKSGEKYAQYYEDKKEAENVYDYILIALEEMDYEEVLEDEEIDNI